MSGWIKLHRSIQSHWIYKSKDPFTKREAWIDMLLEVNHSDQKVCIDNTIIECKCGESLNSLDTWGKRWNWNKSKVRRFLKLLESESMCVTKSVRKTTHLTICNYDKYQVKRNEDETQVKHKRNASETQATPNKNVKNEEEGKKKIYKKKYGEYKNVLLTDVQIEKIKKDFPNNWESLIKDLDEGIQMKGYKYKDHNLALRKWAGNITGNQKLKREEYKEPERDFSKIMLN